MILETASLPIGVFDSGVGGLTVLKALMRRFPHEDFLYLGDTARVPYGTRSPDTICTYALQATSFLVRQPIKLLVVACHTASVHAGDMLRTQWSIPTLCVSHSCCTQLLSLQNPRHIAILATASTIRSGWYQNFIIRHFPEAKIFPIACPLFVPLIEEGFSHHPATQWIAEEYLRTIRDMPLDAIVLACTHYPLLKDLIEKVLGCSASFVEPEREIVHAVSHCLSSHHLRNLQHTASRVQFYVTDGPEKFTQLASQCFDLLVSNVHLVEY